MFLSLCKRQRGVLQLFCQLGKEPRILGRIVAAKSINLRQDMWETHQLGRVVKMAAALL